MAERIVSIGFLTQNDLDMLGKGFRRHFPIDEVNPFEDLLARLDEVTSSAETPNSGTIPPSPHTD